MSSNPNSSSEGSEKYSYPRKIVELGKSHISANTFQKAVETEPDPVVKAKSLQEVESSTGQAQSELAKARAEALAKGQSHNTEQSINASPYKPISPPVQRPVDRRITDHTRLPSEAFSISELPRAPSLEVPLQSLPPPRTKGIHAAQPIAAPVSASTSTSGQVQAQGQSPLATSTGTTTVERTGSIQPTTPLELASQSSTSSGQASRKGHRREMNTGGAGDNQGHQPATGTFGQEIDFVKAGINPGKKSADE